MTPDDPWAPGSARRLVHLIRMSGSQAVHIGQLTDFLGARVTYVGLTADVAARGAMTEAGRLVRLRGKQIVREAEMRTSRV